MLPNNSEPVTTRLGIIGGGNMAEVILKVVIYEGFVFGKNVFVTDKNGERLEHLDLTTGARVLDNNPEVLRRAEIILFAVKPQNMPDVLAEIRDEAKPHHLFLSICAGIHTERIEQGLKTDKCPEPRVVRIMPNTPAMIGIGVAGVCKGRYTKPGDIEFAEKVFGAVGTVMRVPEKMMDAVTALTGSGPAYVFYLIESLIEAGRTVGFTEEQSRDMVLQMVLGAATLARKSNKTPADLRRAVTSPGGTTEAGFIVMKERDVKQAIIDTVVAAEKRGSELSKV